MTTRSWAWKQPVYNENVIVHLYMFYSITDVGRNIAEAHIQIVYNMYNNSFSLRRLLYV
jgi:hypothetical protein